MSTKDYTWKEVSMGINLSREAVEEHLFQRIRDPWWRRPLVWARILKPRYRKITLGEALGLMIYGDAAEVPDQFQGLQRPILGEEGEE
jgi:hypothetical protein